MSNIKGVELYIRHFKYFMLVTEIWHYGIYSGKMQVAVLLPTVCRRGSKLVTLHNTVSNHLWCVRTWCALRHFSLKSLCSQEVQKKRSCTKVTQYLCLRTTAASEVWGQQLDQRNPPPAAEHKHRVTRRMKLVRNTVLNKVNNNVQSHACTHSHPLISLISQFHH